MSRSILVLALLVVAVAGGGAALAAESDDGTPAAVGAPSPITPVLSARRVPGLLAAPVADRRLAGALDAVLARQPGAACLTVSSGGRSIVAVNAEAALVPASLEKLLTAAAALDVLGPDHRFTTRVVAGAAPVDGSVVGDAWLVGGGDPLMATADYSARFENQPQTTTSLEALADALVGAGVGRIEGRLVGDESRYDRDRYPDAWPARFVDQDLSGPLSALTVNDAWAAYPPSPDVRTPDETPAADPALQGAGVLAMVLAGRGVSVGAGVGSGSAPVGAVEVAAVESPPLREIVGEMLRESDNQTAELVLKELALASGRPATTFDGATVVGEVAARLGLPVDTSVVVDGSGLALDNRQSCAVFQAILDAAGPSSAIADGLAVAGETGTLARRFLDSPVTGRLRAKTGTLNLVTALAGYLDTTPGAQLSFTFIVNLVAPDRVDLADLALQDDLVAALATYPEGPSLDELGPQPVAVTQEGVGG
jgi:D-alanyl-D-alanine carboxypeptidase/D-alanyl-D-alanine-endopeptidase (penicillin-binding protein 4)